jgi:hypothetical protein
MSSTSITITKFNGTNYVQCAPEIALLLEQKPVYEIINAYDEKPEEAATNVTATEKAAFKDWINRHGVARSTILLGMEPRIQAEYTVVEDGQTLSEKLVSGYKSKLKLNIFESREDLWSIKLQDCRDVDNYTSGIDRKVKDYNLCAGPLTTNTDTDTAKTIANDDRARAHLQPASRNPKEVPRTDQWKVCLELMMNTNATTTAMPDEIVTKLAKKQAAIKRENLLGPEALLFAKNGGRGSRGGKVGKSPERDTREDKRDKNENKTEKEFRKCFHSQRRGHTTENRLSKQYGNPPKYVDTTATASTETTSTFTTLIENYWILGS